MPKKSKSGRPEKMTPERREQIVKSIAMGMTRERAALYAGVSRSVFFAYQAKNSDFQDRVQQAESECQMQCLTAIRAASEPKYQDKTRIKTGPPIPATKTRAAQPGISEKIVERIKKSEGRWEAAAWLLERRWPEEFGRVDRHLLHVQRDFGGPLPEQYIQAIQQALGIRGQLESIGPALLTSGNGDGAIDADVLPQD